MPIGFAMGMVGFAGLLVFAGGQIAFDSLSMITLSESQKYALSAIPLFVMMAQLLVVTKVGAVAYDSAAKLLSGLPGSLAIATNAAGTMLGAVMGSSAAACATLSHIGIAEMKRYGYSNTFTAAQSRAPAAWPSSSRPASSPSSTPLSWMCPLSRCSPPESCPA